MSHLLSACEHLFRLHIFVEKAKAMLTFGCRIYKWKVIYSWAVAKFSCSQLCTCKLLFSIFKQCDLNCQF